MSRLPLCRLLALHGALLCAALPLAAQQDDGPFHDGRWQATIERSEAGYRSARVQLADFGGHWQDASPAKSVQPRGCAGKRFPITVQRSRTDELEFMVWGSAVSPACPDLSALLRRVDERTLEGTLGNEGRLRLTRSR
jgi:hypothetical protein